MQHTSRRQPNLVWFEVIYKPATELESVRFKNITLNSNLLLQFWQQRLWEARGCLTGFSENKKYLWYRNEVSLSFCKPLWIPNLGSRYTEWESPGYGIHHVFNFCQVAAGVADCFTFDSLTQISTPLKKMNVKKMFVVVCFLKHFMECACVHELLW